ncbi:MAG: anthranilate synthase component I [Clostridiales bacterium]|nr:anthranilate synthase component I [Clostridiales bacterium]
MNILPKLEDVRELAKSGKYNAVPLSTSILSDIKTPIEVLRILKNVSRHCYLLESVENNEKWGRYTFLGFEPKMEITCMDGKMKVGDLSFDVTHPGTYLRQILNEYKSPRLSYLPTFTGGLVGYFSYDYIKYAEPSLKLDAKDTESFKDVDLMLFDKVIAFDNLMQKIVLIVNIKINDSEENIEKEYRRGERDLQELRDLILNGKPAEETPGKLKGEMTALFEKDEYCAMVEKAKHHIKEGDIFQIVLSNRLEGEFEGSLLNVYRVLRTVNPSPYMFYFSGTDVEVAGASPETLVKLENGTAYTFPLAGTRKRGATEEEDQELERELLADPKELAEHNMLVDLGRNDIGKIAKFGSVKVDKYHEIERFSHVMHIGSTVKGEIRDDMDAIDAIDAILPAGTLSGAPKIRACELINELENNKRGIYGGAIGYVDFTGNLDTCIAIRIAFKKGNKVFVRSGAGIVYDSVPEKEYQECINKAAAVVKAIELAEEVDK